ncbi:alpha/beta hydrolase [Deinococcus sp. QL22]|uniref:alpha/beta hydrolase n=1 Tax=Deinococcus sp. QL22 TaxID=2939437 RepID=UPI0020179D05|nr:alpha/beta hydrolase [Deinococcus sp. QL22]UQN09790.1 lysophospholipase [Deinococcus sp. QL22]
MSSLLFLLFLSLSASQAAPIQLRASDGLTLYGEYTTPAQPKGAVLLLHAAGQNLHEFDAIAHRLTLEGYASLALDQRFGGEYDGYRNRTVQHLGNRVLSEADALTDLDLALTWLRRQHPRTRLFAMGSGSSGTLLFPFALRQPDLAGLLAFSPVQSDLVEIDMLAVARQVRVPVFVTSSNDPFEIQAAQEVFCAVGASRRTLFVPPGFGLRGVVNLNPAKTTEVAVTEAYWAAVLKFFETP